MLPDSDGSLWLTTIDHGLLKLDPARKEFSRYLSGQTTRVFEDAEGTIWVGTRNRGVVGFIRSPAAFVNYGEKDNSLKGPKDDIQSVGTDSHGLVWIGTANGLQMLDPKTGGITRYQHDAQNPYSISNAPVFAIAEPMAPIEVMGFPCM